jgi:hypothetical protein
MQLFIFHFCSSLIYISPNWPSSGAFTLVKLLNCSNITHLPCIFNTPFYQTALRFIFCSNSLKLCSNCFLKNLKSFHSQRRHLYNIVYTQVFLTTTLVGGTWSASRSGRFIPGERAPSAQLIGGWVGLRAGLEDTEKRTFLTLPGLELRPVDRPGSSYIDNTIPAPHLRLFPRE